MFRREKIRQGMLRKKECESKALSVVEEMIVQEVDREQFRKAVSKRLLLVGLYTSGVDFYPVGNEDC